MHPATIEALRELLTDLRALLDRYALSGASLANALVCADRALALLPAFVPPAQRNDWDALERVHTAVETIVGEAGR